MLRGKRCISNAFTLQCPSARQERQSSPPGMAFFPAPSDLWCQWLTQRSKGSSKKVGYRRITFQRASVGNCRKHSPGLLSRKKQSLVLKHSNSWTRLSFSSLLSCHFSALGGVESGLGGRNTQAQKPAA